jgi:hypothetical protein
MEYEEFWDIAASLAQLGFGRTRGISKVDGMLSDW